MSDSLAHDAASKYVPNGHRYRAVLTTSYQAGTPYKGIATYRHTPMHLNCVAYLQSPATNTGCGGDKDINEILRRTIFGVGAN